MSTIWGPYLYQRDADLDILDLIANEAARMFLDPDSLRCPLMPEYFSLRSPIDKDSVIQELNGGVFQRLLRRFKHADLDMAVVLTAAVGMELGVRFLEEDMLMMVEALEGYGNDGREWVFRRMGVKKGVAEDRLDASGDEEEAVAGARGVVGKEPEATTQKPLPVLPHDKPVKHTQHDQSPEKELTSAFKKPGNEKGVTFRLPKSKSHPVLKGHWRKDSKDVHIKNLTKTNSPGRKLVWGRTTENEREILPVRLDCAESIFRLPPPKPMTKGKGKENRKLV
ncbi:MAG: hypothetical protein L6R41_007105 [Letrouitia leprolyta]|nr:MAG: hypothetical protein L6R41_007105 [Letrouitia leprolyta]